MRDADAVLADATRAARLSKADLLTLMVGEFPELQGTIGAYYARGDGGEGRGGVGGGRAVQAARGLGRASADASGDLFGAGGQAGADGVLLRAGVDPEREQGPVWAAARGDRGLEDHPGSTRHRPEADGDGGGDGGERATVAHQAADQILQFIGARLRSELLEDTRTDLVDAVLAAGFDRPQDARARVKALHDIAQEADLEPLGEAFKRINNILQKNAAR